MLVGLLDNLKGILYKAEPLVPSFLGKVTSFVIMPIIFILVEDAKMYISSADLMTRNLNRRVEVACPVYDPEAREMIRKILEIQLSDNVKASFMQPDGSYKSKRYPGMTPLDSQYEFMKNPLHHKRPEPQPQKAPPLDSFKQRLMNFLGIKKK